MAALEGDAKGIPGTNAVAYRAAAGGGHVEALRGTVLLAAQLGLLHLEIERAAGLQIGQCGGAARANT